MKFKEFVAQFKAGAGNYKYSNGQGNPYVGRLSNLGVASFSPGVTDKNTPRTPHEEINKCLIGFETIPIVNSGVTQLASFIIPNKKIKITSNDKKTREFLLDWHNMRENILDEYRNILITNIICGNAAMEKHYSELTNNSLGDDASVLDNIFSVNNMPTIWRNPDDRKGEYAYFIEVPWGMSKIFYMGEWKVPNTYQVKYVKNYQFNFQMIYAFNIPAWKFAMYTSGWSRDNIYGRSGLASCIDAINIFNEIFSSWDTIARTRQIDTKLLTPDVTDPSSINLDQNDMNDLASQLADQTGSFKILNIPLKLVQQDITTSGGYDLMTSVYDIVRRTIQTALLPNYLTPWSDTATTQGVEISAPPLLGRIKAKQNEFTNWLNQNIIGELRKTYPWLAEDASFVFDEPKIMPDSIYIDNMSKLLLDGVITAEEYRDYLFNMGIVDADMLQKSEDKTNNIDYKNEDNEGKDFHEKNDDKPVKADEQSITKNETASTESFDVFRKKMAKKSEAPDTTGWKQLKVSNIGGHVIRLIEGIEDYYIYDGLIKAHEMQIEGTDRKTLNSHYDKYIEQVKADFDEIQEGVAPEDVLFDEIQADIEKEYNRRFKIFLKAFNSSSRKTEAFLGKSIFKKLEKAFIGFNKFINKTVSSKLRKLGIIITEDDNETTGEPDKKTKSMVTEKNAMLVKDLSDQIKETKDEMLKGIKRDLTQGIQAGMDISDVKAKVEKDYNYEDGVKWKMDRVLQTSGRVQVKIIKLRKWKAMGFETAVWITRNDKKVRDKHQKLNKKVYTIDKLLFWFTSGTTPGTDFNCRCSLAPHS